MTTSARIFINYRRSDSAGWARQLHGELAARFGAERVFRDVAIEPGVDFVEHIEQVMGACEVCIAVIGPRWADATTAAGHRRLDEPDDLVCAEIQRALERPDVHVVPVLVDGARMPGEDQLPEGLRPLARRNACELSDSRWDYDVELVCRCLRHVLGESRSERRQGPAPTAASGSGGGSGRAGRAALVALVLAVLLSGVGVAVGASGGDDHPVAPANSTSSEKGDAAAPRDRTTSATDAAREVRTTVPVGSRKALIAQNDRAFLATRRDPAGQLAPLQKAVDGLCLDESDINCAFALFNLAHALRLSGRPTEAIPLLERRLRISDNQVGAVRSELAAARRAAAT